MHKQIDSTIDKLIKLRTEPEEAISILEPLRKEYDPSMSYKELLLAYHGLYNETKFTEEVGKLSIRDAIKEFMSLTPEFAISELLQYLVDKLKNEDIVFKSTKDLKSKIHGTVRKAVHDLSKAGDLMPIRRGVYRVVERQYTSYDFENVNITPETIILPFNLHNYVEIYEGNIILIAGTQNVGKTALLLNIVSDNMDAYETYYWNSEMGVKELFKRLTLFEDVPPNGWNFGGGERNDNFEDVIVPGKGKLHVIDYLEIYENFYEIGAKINNIYKALEGALAVIAIQKPPGRDTGVGGMLSLDKPRLALAVEKGRAKITKAKNWRQGTGNPNGLVCDFHIINGSKIVTINEWREEI